ncbi:RNA-binding protein RO60 isoform X1 [Diorhabda carinulata]|uniref:RNA-binding protein RO60 isoform X1 n=1 Tax=Diorhabda carinulata TaxID=1163345 RepID=UPI0025A1D72E|nr:RNA-binding protein RO60 isoform X1 [Diorhabda carinulata]XP_057669696.1 RNA-binding protein RO60 isoform X1 [Diorhabda carinulata]
MATSKLSNEEQLKRLIYVCNVRPIYYCGGPEKYMPISKLKIDLLETMLKNNYMELLNVIESINDDKLIPYRTQIFNVLCFALRMENATPEKKNAICALARKLMKTDTDFFEFVKYASRFHNNKLSKTVRKAIISYYSSKSPEELAQFYVSAKSVHGRSHKDLIKLCHMQSKTPEHNIVINYILKNSYKANEPGHQILEVMRKVDTLRKTSDHKVAVPLIQELKATINQVEPKLRKSAEVWSAVLLNMSLKEVLPTLTKLYKLGFLKKDSPILARVTEILTNGDKIKSSGIHPLEVFIYMKNFERGGKPLDAKLLQHLQLEKKLTEEELKKLRTPHEVKCPIVLSNLQKCMNISCNNIQSFGKRYLITIDTTEKTETPCLCNKNITGIEAASAFVWFLLRTEKDVTVAVFKDKDVAIIPLDKKSHINEYVNKLKENKSQFLVMASPIEWATTNKKHFDVFLNFVHHKDYYTDAPKEVRDKMAKPVEALQKYRKKLNHPNAKLVTFLLSSPGLTISDGSPNVLDVCGFDNGVPKLVEAFCRGHFC